MEYGVPAQRIFFRCQAAALPHDYSESAAAKTRHDSAPKDTTAPQFLYVGRLSPEKGLDTLLHAMQIVIAQLPRARLSIVGAGPIKPELEKMSQNLELGESVSFPGSMGVAELAHQYAAATAMVLPSTSEPWGW